MTDHLNHTYDPGTDGIICAATLADAAADPALTLDIARELLREAAEAIRCLHQYRDAMGAPKQPAAVGEHDLSPAKPAPLTNADFNPDDIVRYVGKEWRVQGIDDEATMGLLLLDVAEPKVSPNFMDANFPVTRGSGRRPENGSGYRWCWAGAGEVKLVSRGKPEARVGGRGEAHPDDAAVDAFAAAMKAKLAEARAKGRGGWQNKADCSQQRLSDMLRAHVEKGDPRDVANFACFLWNRGEGIAPRQPEARVGGEDCHCATCTCASGMTPAIRFDASPAEREGAVRDQLIAMGWTPPQQPAPVAPEGWRPIESAPKVGVYRDGHNHYSAYILVCSGHYDTPRRARWWFRDDSDSSDFIADGGVAVYPTHWMPLPEPPKETDHAQP